MSSEAAKDCPWHGDASDLAVEDNGVGCFWIICTKNGCGCEGPYGHSEEEAWEKWNRRATPSPASGELASLVERLKPSWAVDETVGRAVSALRMEAPMLSAALNEWLVENNGLKSLAASQLAAVAAERDAALDRDWVSFPAYESAIEEGRKFRDRALTAERLLAEARALHSWPTEAQFQYGDWVEKFTGEALWEGRVVSAYHTKRLALRYVVEVEPQGFQMIAVPAQLRSTLSPGGSNGQG